MSEAEKALGPGAKDEYDTPEEAASAALLDGSAKEQDQAPSTPATPPPASATANTGTTSANAGASTTTGDKA